MIRLLYILLISICYLPLKSQILDLYPSEISPLNLSETGEKEYREKRNRIEQLWAIPEEKITKQQLNELDNLLEEIPETSESYWETVGGGCSWYCGGGPKMISSSSFLESQGTNNYKASNIHDFSLKSAWIEGGSGYGIGEFIDYKFSAASPRITEIKVVNGYVKNQITYTNNSRVKRLKVLVNGKPYAFLNLKDTRSIQIFNINPLGSDPNNSDNLLDNPDWVMRFEILEVYKGDKYKDTAITEIFFDGIDVHCFSKGTKIKMSDRTEKNIEDLIIGDKIIAFNPQKGSFSVSEIKELQYKVHHNMVKYVFEDGSHIISTRDHPFLLANNSWASSYPKGSSQYNGFSDYSLIKTGDIFLTFSGKKKLIKIFELEGHFETYTITKLSVGNTFLANGFIVGVEDVNYSITYPNIEDD
ncbi:MAG: hypothetical protein OEW75_08245 [Cyclobacteriaceae bacterium]|nr:hypothetical protein [Cyclobacteriaceae bacterium]